MYFAIGPKQHYSDLYGFQREHRQLADALKSENRLIIIKGLRRTGKTSLLNSVYEELPSQKVYIDAREIGGMSSPRVHAFFISRLTDYLKGRSIFRRFLGSISGIEAGVKVSVRQQNPVLSAILSEINGQAAKKKECFCLFIDEAQLLKQSGFDNFLAFAYDRLQNVKIVIAGSEIGLLDEFAGENSRSPLFGRVRETISTRKFARDESLDFLREGFSQAHKKHSESELEEAVDTLNGTVGWLSMYGFYALSAGHSQALKRTREEGAKIVKDELEAFLAPRKVAEKAYVNILYAVSNAKSWTEIKNYLMLKLGRKIADPQLLTYLDALEKYGFIEKRERQYSVSDPMIKHAVEKFYLSSA